MPKHQEIHSVLVIGSGPIVIGQAAEFDYAGTQACAALKEEGIHVILVNNNPATIMTDETYADKVYFEPMTAESVANIIKKKSPMDFWHQWEARPDSTLPWNFKKAAFLKNIM